MDKQTRQEKGVGDDIVYNPLLFDPSDHDHAEFLQKQGEIKLDKSDIKGIKCFDQVVAISPNDANFLVRQGKALAAYGQKTKTKKYLLLASKKYKGATRLTPEDSLSWAAWGDLLLHLGETYKDYHFFLDARDRYQKAIEHSSRVSEDEVANIHWNFGKVMVKIAGHSGEVSDLSVALESMAKASSLNEKLPAAFWQDFGQVSLKLGVQINDVRLYMKAINCYKNAIGERVSSFESWYYLADALAQLYAVTHDDDHHAQANECFTNAAKLHPQNDKIWLSWARLLLISGKRIGDKKRLHSALEKCHRAYSCNSKDPEVLTTWSEVFGALGILSENLEYIYQANNKAAEAEELYGMTVAVAYAQGMNLYALGKYYNDQDYYYQAIEKLQEGLSIDRTVHKLWFQIGHIYSIVGRIESDPLLFERAGKFFTRAINLCSNSTYYFEYACSLVKLANSGQDRATLETALVHFEQAFHLQENAVYLHPDWLYEYALALDLMGDLVDEDKYYVKAIEILKRVLMLDPDFPEVHYKLALVHTHLGELSDLPEFYQRAISHYKIAFQENQENESLILDWSICLINLAELTPEHDDSYGYTKEQLLREAEYKLIQSAKLGNKEVYYHLSCLYSLLKHFEKSMFFLEKAESLDALPPIDDVMEDSWLDNLRQTEIFRSFINHLST